jgi:hypothetical protein
MADQRLGVEAGELFLTHRERDHRNVGRLDALVAEFLVEGNVGVAVDADRLATWQAWEAVSNAAQGEPKKKEIASF